MNTNKRPRRKEPTKRKSSSTSKKSNPVAVAAIPIRPYDVILGRGKATADNVGNRRLHVTVDAHLASYQRGSKVEKTQITRNVVALIQSCGGRFLKGYNSSEEVHNDVAREKVSHLFRDKSKKALLRHTTTTMMGDESQSPDTTSRRQEEQEDAEKFHDLLASQQSILHALVRNAEPRNAATPRSLGE